MSRGGIELSFELRRLRSCGPRMFQYRSEVTKRNLPPRVPILWERTVERARVNQEIRRKT